MNCYIPSDLDLENLIPNSRKHRDKYYYFIHKLYEERLFDRSRYEDKNCSIHLHSHTLRNIIGEKSFYPIRDNLVNRGIIEINHSYSINEFSKSYRLTDKYRGVKHRQVIITDENILQRIYRHKQKLINEIPEGVEYDFLYNNLERIDIDYLKANDFIISNCSDDPDKYNCYKISVDYIYEKNFFFKVDNIAGRVHTNISNFPSELRQFLTYDGKSLINIDIRNSQPFLFNILIFDYFNIPSQTLGSPFLYSYNTNNISPYVVTYTEDVKKYIELTSKGMLYEYLMNEGGLQGIERQEFKKKFFGTVFFCDLSEKYTYKEAKLFKKLFPNVFQIIGHYKKEDYTQLAINLQKAEANIIINKVIKKIAIERPEMFVTTIHDSIMTTEENINYVSDVMLSEFENDFNLKPSIKIE